MRELVYLSELYGETYLDIAWRRLILPLNRPKSNLSTYKQHWNNQHLSPNFDHVNLHCSITSKTKRTIEKRVGENLSYINTDRKIFREQFNGWDIWSRNPIKEPETICLPILHEELTEQWPFSLISPVCSCQSVSLAAGISKRLMVAPTDLRTAAKAKEGIPNTKPSSLAIW